MSAKAVFRTVIFLLILFVVVYVGTENTQTIDFRFPLLLNRPVRASAALIFFGVFAVGVIGGSLLHADQPGARSGRDGSARKK